MPGFLYFLPKQRNEVTAELISQFNLDHIRDDASQLVHSRECVNSHPSGLSGLVCGVAGTWEAEEVKQAPDIEWVAFPKSFAPITSQGDDSLRPWLGWKRGQLPRPEDLRRAAGTIEGEHLRLADGHLWEVPIARDFEGHCTLPMAYDLDDDSGEWVVNKVRREYAKIWDHANSYHLAMRTAYVEAQAAGETGFTFTIPDGEQLVVDALAVNYRVSARELATLGVLVSGIIQDIADILTDQRTPSSKKKLASDIGTD